MSETARRKKCARLCISYATALERRDVEESTVTSASFPSIRQSLLLGGQSFDLQQRSPMKEETQS